MPATSGIYKILCRVSGKFYIGSSCDTHKRRLEHWSSLRRGAHHASRLQRAWTKYGEAAFEFEVIERVPVERLIEAEQRWLDTSRSYDRDFGYNSATCAEASARGRKHSEASKEKNRAAAKKRMAQPGVLERMREAGLAQMADPENRVKAGAANIGRVPTAEQLAKASAALQGHGTSDETVAKIRAALRGKKFTTEHLANLTAARRARASHSAETKAKMAASQVARHAAKKQQEALHV